MKKLVILSVLILLSVSCKKDDWVTPIKINTMFQYEGDQDTKFLVKPDGQIPTNPFIVDSVCRRAYNGLDGYWVSSHNNLVYMMDPVVIRKHALSKESLESLRVGALKAKQQDLVDKIDRALKNF